MDVVCQISSLKDFIAVVVMSLKKSTYPGAPLLCLWPTAEVLTRKEDLAYYYNVARS